MDKKRTGVIYGVNGPVIYLQGKSDFKMSEMVYVGEQRLVGEVIALDKEGIFTEDPGEISSDRCPDADHSGI